MSDKKQLKGMCAYCGTEIAKRASIRHLASCAGRRDIIAKTQSGKGASELFYHLRIQAVDRDDFWLDLEMCGFDELEYLDSYLKSIWLECCGHFSQFSSGGKRQYREIPMNLNIGEVFLPGVKVMHTYDFGTPSKTLIKAVGAREGKPTTSHPVALMARNVMPDYKCVECGEKAASLCMGCRIKKGAWKTLCNNHAKMHTHDGYGGPMPLLNSPRLGMCAYNGPAEPPY